MVNRNPQCKLEERSLSPEHAMDGDRKSFSVPGLTCGNCGERLPTVLYSEQVPGLIVRDRRCPACGHSNKTAERVISSGPVRRYFRG